MERFLHANFCGSAEVLWPFTAHAVPVTDLLSDALWKQKAVTKLGAQPGTGTDA